MTKSTTPDPAGENEWMRIAVENGWVIEGKDRQHGCWDGVRERIINIR